MRSTAAWVGLASVALAVAVPACSVCETTGLQLAGLWSPFVFWWIRALAGGFREDRALGIWQGILVSYASFILLLVCVALALVFRTLSDKLSVIVAVAPAAVFLWSWQQHPLDWISVRGLICVVTVLQIIAGGMCGLVDDMEQSLQTTVFNIMLSYGIAEMVHSMNNDMLREKKVEPGDGEEKED